MTEFTELTVEKDIDDMEAGELRETLSDFMDQHEKNTQAYDGLQTEYEDKLDEREGRIDELEDRISEFKQEKAEEASEYVKMPADLLAERFEFSELEQIIEEAEESEEFSEDDESEDDEDERLTEFSEKPPKGRRDGGSGRSKEHRKRAVEALGNNGFPAEME